MRCEPTSPIHSGIGLFSKNSLPVSHRQLADYNPKSTSMAKTGNPDHIQPVIITICGLSNYHRFNTGIIWSICSGARLSGSPAFPPEGANRTQVQKPCRVVVNFVVFSTKSTFPFFLSHLAASFDLLNLKEKNYHYR